MSKSILKLAFGIGLITTGANSYAQCPAFTDCMADTVISNDAGNCDAIFNYTTPSATDLCGTGADTLLFTGAMQTWTVPGGITSITIEVYGAQGGNDGTVLGGLGGYAVGDLAVTPGQVLNVYVGGKGTDGPGSGQNCGLAGGFNGGGPTGATCCSNAGSGAGAGGGASDVRVGGTALADRVIVGAGGGGAGSNIQGSAGGGLTGSDGTSYNGVLSTGGTQSAGGQAGGTFFPNHTCSPATDGSLGQGGDGDGNDGGGGGGGYYGGGGGANNGPGSGGSSYIGGVTSASTTGGVHSGDGMVIISYNGGPVTITQINGLASGSAFPIGTTVNTFVAEAGGVTDTCEFTVTVQDTENPTITCPGNVNVCETTVTGIGATTSDNCAGETVSYVLSGATTGSGSGDADGLVFNPGVTTVDYIVTDASGNTDSCAFDVTVDAIADNSVTVSGQTLTANATGVFYQWIDCSTMSPISGETNQSYTGTAGGSYAVVLTNGAGCSDTSACTVISGAGIDGTFGSEFNLFPNPTEGMLTIDLGDYNQAINAQVLNVEGKVIYEQVQNKSVFTIDLTGYSDGVYTVVLSNANNQVTYRITKQ